MLSCLLATYLCLSDFDTAFRLEKKIAFEETEEVALLSVRSIARDREGRLFVIDSRAGNLKVFDEQGKVLRSIGRRGEGPGEFGAPVGITLWKNQIFVQDMLRARIHIFDKDTDAFLKALPGSDAREILAYKDRLYLGSARLADDTSLQILDLEGQELASYVRIPEITRSNQLVSSNVSFDLDEQGRVYLLHEMDYQIIRVDEQGQEKTLVQGSSPAYVAPPSEPFKAFHSRELLKKWGDSWSSLLKLAVLKSKGLILVSYIPLEGGFALDTYTLAGERHLKTMKSDKRLVLADEHAVYFIAEAEEGYELLEYTPR